MRRTIPLIITFLSGLIMIVPYYFNGLDTLQDVFLDWYKIISTFAYVLGVGSLIIVNGQKIQRQAPGWGYNAVLLGSLAFSLYMGFAHGYYNLDTPSFYVFWYIYNPLSAAMFSLLAFFIASAAFRAFKAKTLEATLLLTSAIIVMLGRVPPGEKLWSIIPYFGQHWKLGDLIDTWMMGTFNAAGQRAILLGASIGIISISLKILLGVERSYLGGDEEGQVLETLNSLDRRWLFLIVGVTVMLAVIFNVRVDVEPTPAARGIYDFIEGLKAGDTILLGFDYGPSTEVECDPMAVTMLQQCFRKGIRVISIVVFAPEGVPFMRADMKRLADEYHKQYGVDYVNLGYQTGGIILIKSLGLGFATAFPSDVDGRPLNDLPLMRQVKGYKDVAGVMSMSAGDPGIKQWVQVVSSEFKRPVGGGVTAVSFPEMQPYLSSGQMMGMLGGLRGAAEYETLVGIKGKGTKGMFAQTVMHIMMTIFIIISNVVYFGTRWRAQT